MFHMIELVKSLFNTTFLSRNQESLEGKEINRIFQPVLYRSLCITRSPFTFVDHLLVELVVPKGCFAGHLLNPSYLQELTIERQRAYEMLMPEPQNSTQKFVAGKQNGEWNRMPPN